MLAVKAGAAVLIAALVVAYPVTHTEHDFSTMPPEECVVKEDAVIRPLPSEDLDTLASALSEEWRHKASGDVVPDAAPQTLPGGLDQLDVGEKKILFLRSILPHVLKVNANIRMRREALETIADHLNKKLPLKEHEAKFIKLMGERYMTYAEYLDWREEAPEKLVAELLLRVDEVPPSLVLAQAALESAWGSSRFAVEGNNIFGLWVFSATKGMIPRNREEGANYSLAKYDSITESVESYFRSLNTLYAYEDFRTIRAKLRETEGRLDAEKLAEGLTQYSVRRDEYVQDVLNLIEANRLTRFDSAKLIDKDFFQKKARPADKQYGPLKTSASDA